MIPSGTILKSVRGNKITVDGFHKAGGQGEVYWATYRSSGERGVLKIFHKQFCNDDSKKRIEFLMNQDLASTCPILCSPTDMTCAGELVGHFTPLAPGINLEEFLGNPNSEFLDGLNLAVSLAHALSVMHDRQIAHGDLHAENILVNRVMTVLQLHLIDLDNFNAPNLPGPPMMGQNLYLAPELRLALENGSRVVPDLFTDRFSLGVVMHEIILLRHVAAGADETEADFSKAMYSGRWLNDPACFDRATGNLGGYPSEVLNPDLARLFRSALSLDPSARPAPEKWKTELLKAINSVFCCPVCGGPFLIDTFKTKCPYCGKPFPTMGLKSGSGRILSLEHGATVVGRNDLGGSMRVSARHAIFRRMGPEMWLESLGVNGTYRWASSGWVRLPDKKPVLVQSGDRLMLGDSEAILN